MSMHMERPGLTTTSYKKRKVKVTKAMQAELEQGWRDRNQRLKAMGLPKETLEQYTDWVHGRGKKEKEKKNTGKKITKAVSGIPIRSSFTDTRSQASPQTTDSPFRKEWITGPVSSPAAKVYTGTKVKGIAQTHKSNAIPIFDETHIIDIAHMRR